MKITKYFYTPKFKKRLKKIPHKEKAIVIKRINFFLSDPYSFSLKTHKLSGKLKDYWAFSVSLKLRIIFRFRKENIVEFIDFGGHEIYK